MIKIYTLTSALHDAARVDQLGDEFLTSIGLDFEIKGADFSDYETGLIYVRTGGSEGIFKALLPDLPKHRPFYLLTSGKSNSLAASMEILSYLRQQGLRGEILHGSPERLREKILAIETTEAALTKLRGARFGVIGRPSDWLISSGADYAAVREKIGAELIDIPMEELTGRIREVGAIPEELASIPCRREEKVAPALRGAYSIYLALKEIVDVYKLDGLTLRCFDLLTSVGNTGCLGLALLNSEGIVASCEGDIPAMLSMAFAQALTSCTGFQCNPAEMSPEKREILFAHCTLPLSMARRYNFDTHFESGIGAGIHGEIPEGPVTIFKLSGDLSRAFIQEASLISNDYGENLCRTQVRLRLPEACNAIEEYFLKDPVGNHHVIIPGCHAAALKALFESIPEKNP